MTNRKHKPRRPLTQAERSAAADRELERLDRRILRAVQEWAKLWETCPLAGCRRNRRCLHEDACRTPPGGPMTDEDAAEIRAWLASMNDGPKYGDEGVR